MKTHTALSLIERLQRQLTAAERMHKHCRAIDMIDSNLAGISDPTSATYGHVRYQNVLLAKRGFHEKQIAMLESFIMCNHMTLLPDATPEAFDHFFIHLQSDIS